MTQVSLQQHYDLSIFRHARPFNRRRTHPFSSSVCTLQKGMADSLNEWVKLCYFSMNAIPAGLDCERLLDQHWLRAGRRL